MKLKKIRKIPQKVLDQIIRQLKKIKQNDNSENKYNNGVVNMKKVKKVLSTLITVILSIILIFIIFVVISSKASGGKPNLLGYQLETVLSGSMEPSFKTGSIIAVKFVENLGNLKKDDIIT